MITPSRPERTPDGAPEDLARALDRNVAVAGPPLLLGLTLLYTLLVPAHLVFLGYDRAPVLAAASGASAVLLFAGAIALARGALPRGSAHVTGTLVALLVLANTLLHLAVGGEPRETLYLVLLLLGVGLLFLDWGWFALVVTAAFVGWTMTALPHLPDPDWVHHGIVLVVSGMLATTVMTVRRSSLVRLEELRMQERVRQIELESALDQTERARQGGEEARKAMESAIVQVRESEERFRRLAEATFEGVVFFRDGRVLDANARAAQIFGIAVPQIIGDPVLNLVAKDDREEARPFLLDARGGGVAAGPDALEVEGRRYDGTFFPMEMSVVDSLYQGETARVLVLRDVTNRKRVEQVLRRALEEAEAAAQAKNSFLANMSHELRTPLNSVIGFANILLKRQVDRIPDRDLDYLRRIQTNGEHLLALIEDILDLSKIEAQRLELVREPIQLDELATEVVQMLDLQARRKGLELRTRVPAGLRPVVADHRRLKQVLLNLLGNAVKFTLEGRVTIRVVPAPEGDRALRIEVEDTGIGIPESQLEAIFVPFHQVDISQARNFGGTGLGLTISRSLCELMGFELTARSVEGEGSVFALLLEPHAVAGAHGAGPPSPAASARPSGPAD